MACCDVSSSSIPWSWLSVYLPAVSQPAAHHRGCSLQRERGLVWSLHALAQVRRTLDVRVATETIQLSDSFSSSAMWPSSWEYVGNLRIS